MELGELKPVLTTLALPPAGPLLLIALGLLLAWRRKRRAGIAVAATGLGALWVLSCSAVALWLAGTLLPQFQPVRASQLEPVQAIVVLGGGVVPQAPEYGQPQLGAASLARLRYGAWLARQTGKPLAFAGGVGWWTNTGIGAPAEAELARRHAAEDFGLELTWVDPRSRDTFENARNMAALLTLSGVSHIALVTHSWHMPRAAAAFQEAGLQVLPAPMGFPVASERPVLQWLPSVHGMSLSRTVLREWLGSAVPPSGPALP
jgi:uncharacterized SAM-binding protein YcdF (DUF218 family)